VNEVGPLAPRIIFPSIVTILNFRDNSYKCSVLGPYSRVSSHVVVKRGLVRGILLQCFEIRLVTITSQLPAHFN